MASFSLLKSLVICAFDCYPVKTAFWFFFFFLTAICIEPGVIELLVKVLGCTARYISNIKRTYTNKGMQTKNYINAKEN